MFEENITITDPKAWTDFMQSVNEKWFRYFVDGRRVVKPQFMRIVSFKYLEPEIEEHKCQECFGSGEIISQYHAITEGNGIIACPACGGKKTVMKPTGPGVVGSSIVIEEGIVSISVRVGGEMISKKFRHLRGCVSADNRTGSTRFEELKGDSNDKPNR